MTTELRHLHHVGHVVHDMAAALALYRRLGFDCAPAMYPVIAPAEGEPAQPFGVANTHANFLRNFIELATAASVGAPLPEDAVLVPIQVPAAVLPRILDALKRSVATLAAGLARFEGLHILVLQSDDIAASAARLDSEGVRHSGVNTAQRQIETTDGMRVTPVRFLEIDQEPVPEGRLAIAENPPSSILQTQRHMAHPNGALDLVEAILCVPDHEQEAHTQRYARYLGRTARVEDTLRIFDLQDACITLVPAASLGKLLPGETAPALPAFVAYAVTVRDLRTTETLLRQNGFQVATSAARDIFVPARSALGAAVIFRQG